LASVNTAGVEGVAAAAGAGADAVVAVGAAAAGAIVGAVVAIGGTAVGAAGIAVGGGGTGVGAGAGAHAASTTIATVMIARMRTSLIASPPSENMVFSNLLTITHPRVFCIFD